nr:hypothetical protein [uncultured Ruminococcus sp.]
MRKTSRSGSFFLILMFNIMLNFRLTIPGWILLILHFIIPQYIKWWYCLVYFGAFLLYMIVWMLVLWGLGRWAGSAPPAPKVQNKNPYSVKEQELPWNKTDHIENKNPYSVKTNDLSDYTPKDE